MNTALAQLLVCTLLLVLTAAPTHAVELTLSPSAIADALGAGALQAGRGDGYAIGAYLLFSVDDALHIVKDDETVEAVVVGTPYERLRFHAYLRAHEGMPETATGAATFAAQSTGMLEFVVFVHSRTANDREFMQRFGAGILEAGGRSHPATEVTRTDPALDAYYRPDGSVLKRWLGQVTYRFDLRGEEPAGTAATAAIFSFTDDAGAVHRYALIPARYR